MNTSFINDLSSNKFGKNLEIFHSSSPSGGTACAAGGDFLPGLSSTTQKSSLAPASLLKKKMSCDYDDELSYVSLNRDEWAVKNFGLTNLGELLHR